jgi:hypothetical protein
MLLLRRWMEAKSCIVDEAHQRTPSNLMERRGRNR